MPTLSMSKREPLAAPASGHARTVTVDDKSFRVTVTKHQRDAASASWRMPERYTMATVESLPDGARLYHGRVHDRTREVDILHVSGVVPYATIAAAEAH